MFWIVRDWHWIGPQLERDWLQIGFKLATDGDGFQLENYPPSTPSSNLRRNLFNRLDAQLSLYMSQIGLAVANA